MPALSRLATRLVSPVAKQMLLAWERLESGVAYDPTSPSTRHDPYGLYDQLRRKDPVHRMRLLKAWALTRYEDGDRLLRDHKRFTSEGRNYGYSSYLTMLDFDPPKHTRLRGLVSKAFTPRAIEKLEPRIHAVVHELLDDVAQRDRFDLIDAVAFPLPVIVIAEMLGVPPEDRDRFRGWSDDIAMSVEPLLEEANIQKVRKATGELFEYFEGQIEKRRTKPQDDLLSALMAAEEAGDRLDREELLSTLMLLLVAGNETTRNLIGNGMLALLRHPDQLERLRQHPDMLDAAIGELLRFDPPVQFDGRIARVDLEIGGKKIRSGERVISLLGAANRDPDTFAEPNRLDIGRSEKSHISFGRGIHYCLGASLAVLEGKVVFAALLERFPTIRLAEPPVRRDQMVLRGLSELWVDIT